MDGNHVSDYNLLIETIDRCLGKVSIQEIASQKLMILGSNITHVLIYMLKACKDYCNDFSYVYIGREEQIESLDEELREGLEFIQWDSQYNHEMVEYLIKSGVASSCEGMIFLGAAHHDLRNINIIEIQAMLNKRLGTHCYVYNFSLDEVYEFRNIDLYLAGINAFIKMNDFMEMLQIAKISRDGD